MNVRACVPLLAGLVVVACGSPPPADVDPLSALGDAGVMRFELSLDAPAAVGSVEGDVVVTRDGAPVTGADVRVTAHMASHTHGSSDIRAEEEGQGRYRVTGLEVTMAGEWELEIDALAIGAEDSTVFEVYVE